MQKWNHCGPSSVLRAMSAHGIVLDQLAVAAETTPDREDTNVSPEELARFARSRGLGAWVRIHGNRDVVRRLVAAGVPVIAEQWIAVEGRGEGVGRPGMDAGGRKPWMVGGNSEGRRVAEQTWPRRAERQERRVESRRRRCQHANAQGALFA